MQIKVGEKNPEGKGSDGKATEEQFKTVCV